MTLTDADRAILAAAPRTRAGVSTRTVKARKAANLMTNGTPPGGWTDADKVPGRLHSDPDGDPGYAPVADAPAPVLATVSNNPTLKLMAALNAAWYAIRAEYPEVADAVIVLSEGKGVKWGHHGADFWTRTDGGTGVTEIMVASDGLHRGGLAVFTTLLHEAAHSLSHTRGVKDTSRQGRYHNVHFERACNHMGMTCECSKAYGYSAATLTAEARALFAHSIDRLSANLTATRRQRTPAPARQAGWLRLECDCGRVIRASAKTVGDADDAELGNGGIICGLCLGAFVPSPSRKIDANAMARLLTATIAKAADTLAKDGYHTPGEFMAWVNSAAV